MIIVKKMVTVIGDRDQRIVVHFAPGQFRLQIAQKVLLRKEIREHCTKNNPKPVSSYSKVSPSIALEATPASTSGPPHSPSLTKPN